MIRKTSIGLLLGLALATTTPWAVAQQQAVVANPEPQIINLGNQRYRIGSIEVDKAGAVFTVPARVLRDEPPIEFLLGTKGGHKNYESVLEADANAFEFNLACILIGLDAANATTMEQRMAGDEFAGDAVAITVSWETADREVNVPGASLLMHGEPLLAVSDNEWIYTGGVSLPDGYYLPEVTGTLLGLVHRGESVIEHRRGIAIGNYGSLLVNNDLLPPVGEWLLLTVTKGAQAP